MHEFAICQNIISQVENIARQHQSPAVHLIKLQIGPLSGIESTLLESAFTIAATGTLAEQAKLSIEIMPVRVKCLSCNKTSSIVNIHQLLCASCGDWHTQLISGDEMILKQIELDLPD
jgi:hydrogenase nickel incorporation protein HypA/HybF